MKNGSILISVVLLFISAGIIIAKADYHCGPQGYELYMYVNNGSNWIEGTLSNLVLSLPKQVYSRAGNQASYSQMVSATTASITNKATKKLFEENYYETKPCWIYSGVRACKYGN